MGVTRSATIALAAWLAGSVAPAAVLRAQAETVSGSDRAAPAPGEAKASSTSHPAQAEAAPPTTALESLGATPPSGGANPSESPAKPDSAAKAQEPAGAGAAARPDASEQAAAPPPSDPQSAALLARISDSAPILKRLTVKEREAIRAFYALGAFKPVWIADGAFTPAAKAVAARLAAAGEDGLDANAYPVPVLGVLSRPDTPAEIADADIKLSAAAALYARDARGGRINLAAISRLITPVLDLPAADTVLAQLAGAGATAGDLLQRYNPRSAGYLALKARLSGLRGDRPAASPSVKLPPGPVLKLGMRDPRVPLIRARFGLENRAAGTLDAGPGEPEDYDASVAAAVSAFQRSHGIPGNGSLNAQTVVALANADTPARAGGDEAALIVNMERWRWLPSELGPDYVLVNVPEFRLRIYRGGALRDETRVIVGKTDSPTPLFSGMMEYAVVNPSWYVPPSILKTMLPKIAHYGGDTWGGYEIVRRNGQVSLRQPPGERNALGFIKFMFPNNHAVYLHDTPNRSLFANSNRALSHGCVRVDDPFRFADAVLPNWTQERLKKLIGKGERTIRLDQKLPVHLAYFTAYLDDTGAYRTLPDIYGHDAPMRAALGLPGGAPAMARAPTEPHRAAFETIRPKPKPRPVAERGAAQRPVPRRSARAEARDDFGEPGLWTPQPAPVTRSWW